MIILSIFCHYFREVKSRYEDTIMKTTVKMTLVKPAINGMEQDTPLYSEPEYGAIYTHTHTHTHTRMHSLVILIAAFSSLSLSISEVWTIPLAGVIAMSLPTPLSLGAFISLTLSCRLYWLSGISTDIHYSLT